MTRWIVQTCYPINGSSIYTNFAVFSIYEFLFLIIIAMIVMILGIISL